jgi:hypothetical protein
VFLFKQKLAQLDRPDVPSHPSMHFIYFWQIDVAPLELIHGELEPGLEKGPNDEAQEAYGRANQFQS